jgi:hypothetical protein
VAFCKDVRGRVVGVPLVIADGLKFYVEGMEESFGADCRFGQLVKQYEGDDHPERIRNGHYKGAVPVVVQGQIDVKDIQTSYIERSNLTRRMGLRRFSRSTNAFSKNLRHHDAAVALQIAHYDLCRWHETLRTAPAVELGVIDHIWTVAELVERAVAVEEPPPLPVEGRIIARPGRPTLRVLTGGAS